MKGFNILVVIFFISFTTHAQVGNEVIENKLATVKESDFYGAPFEVGDILSAEQGLKVYKEMNVTDSLNLKFKSKVREVCQAKGCWMVLDMPNGEQAMVRFKDYSFFMPKDIADKDVIINGIAYVEEMSVEDQRHYASDAGKDKEDLDKIVQPKRTYSFEANGVLILQ